MSVTFEPTTSHLHTIRVDGAFVGHIEKYWKPKTPFAKGHYRFTAIVKKDGQRFEVMKTELGAAKLAVTAIYEGATV
jgi:hypothetical protein